jgi:hypothetical protein
VFKFSNVEVPDSVEVHIAHIITSDLYDLLTELLDLSSEVVLSLLLYIAQLVPSIEVVQSIVELYLASQLMTHGAHEQIVQLVSLVVPCYLTAILEFNGLVSLYIESTRVDPSLSCEAVPSIHAIYSIWSLKHKVRHRWPVLSLLHVYHRAIMTHSLECLSQNRIQLHTIIITV